VRFYCEKEIKKNREKKRNLEGKRKRGKKFLEGTWSGIGLT